MSDKATEWKKFPLADNEHLKGESDYLHGTIAADLNEQLTGGFNKDNFQLIRFHGMYEQDDRDIRAERQAQKLEPNKNVMLRCRLPGGIITPKQWLGIDEFATQHTYYGSIRLTNRQTFQFHGVLKRDIKPMHQWLHQLGLDSIATAGDVNRNVLCTPNPVESELHQQAYEWAKKISEHLLPRTTAYADVWLDGEKVFESETTKPLLKESSDPVEPILGKTYLPRKFKTTVVVPPLNDVDLHANDLNFIAIAEQGQLVGFNVLIGGGLSMDFANHKTYPNIAQELGFVTLDEVLACAEAVVTTQRDWGNRSDRKNAKLRYTLERVGLDVFKAEVEKRAGITLKPLRPYHFTERGDRIGWVKGEDKKWHLTLFIENGRLLDYPDRPLKTGLREIAKIHKGDFRLTANQNLIVAGVAQKDKAKIEKLAREYKLIDDSITPLRQQSMSCVALPTCPLAMAEAERFLPQFIDKVDLLMAKHGMEKESIVLRVTGCPNGCGRAMLAEIGLVGRAIGRYNLYIGGNREGSRIPRLFKENIEEAEILQILDGWIGDWAKNRHVNEGIGDFAIRTGIVKPVTNAPEDFWEVKIA
ncbi:assimilatory sulfite reductase (NADPH) hemoprotein subunit [Gallibacterium sp. AGMB14963]|uniref:assimilatory sulfite reductase (NADPH) hemoprotein subunit n=1 Tax=Gallibacterium faecale TaxID=3019086 RepID=UPI0022F1D09F|nr:assimilatory sulfite reductase (NADPH) hemoprotein subunit [Gallibacterium sp. AGMB14963]MDA3977532.1 assimilatory sulfite reductase (NADPH) hemoprotein subunit [Gallibacterium sp. AGMB14963]